MVDTSASCVIVTLDVILATLRRKKQAIQVEWCRLSFIMETYRESDP